MTSPIRPLRRIFLLTLACILFAHAPARRVEAASAYGAFELGGQILGFLSPDQMRSAGMTWLKMQIMYKRGSGGSTADAQFVIDHARRHGFKVLLSIVGVKSELSSNPSQYYIDYAGFVANVARLNPDAIEVWNEPNIDQEWPAGLINGSNYTQMLKRAYPAIKNANASVMVISAAPAPTGYFGGGCATNGCDDKIFIEQMRNAGAADYFDCTGIHYNEGVLPPSASSGDPRGNSSHYTRYYPTMISTYRNVFPNKPLCFTELGYISPDGLGGLPAGLAWGLNTSAQEQAAWLAQAATLSHQRGYVRLMMVWNVDAQFTPSNVFAGWAMIRQNGQCLACGTLASAMAALAASPSNAAPNRNLKTVSAVKLTWTGLPWATAYQVQVDNSSSFTSPLEVDVTVLAGTLEIATPALTNGKHYWRVRARRPDGAWGGWSASDSFVVSVSS